MHNKFMTIDKVAKKGGGVARNVVYVASANLHEWTSYESAITVRDAGLYRFYSRYFDDMYRLANRSGRLDDYGSSHVYKPSGGKYQVYTFPRREAAGKARTSASNDPVVADVKAARCSRSASDDVINVANVRVARMAVANALIDAGKRGCSVRVLTGDIAYEDGGAELIYAAVNKLAYSSYIEGGVRYCGPVNNISWMHEKFTQISKGTSSGLYVRQPQPHRPGTAPAGREHPPRAERHAVRGLHQAFRLAPHLLLAVEAEGASSHGSGRQRGRGRRLEGTRTPRPCSVTVP